MRVAAKGHVYVLTPIDGEPTEPGRYLGSVARYEGHRDGQGYDAVAVEWARDGRTGEVWPTAQALGALWTHRITVEEAKVEAGGLLDARLCAECGFETSEPVPMRHLLCLDLPADVVNDDWRDLATFARLVAQATLESPETVRRLLEQHR